MKIHNSDVTKGIPITLKSSFFRSFGTILIRLLVFHKRSEQVFLPLRRFFARRLHDDKWRRAKVTGTRARSRSSAERLKKKKKNRVQAAVLLPPVDGTAAAQRR